MFRVTVVRSNKICILLTRRRKKQKNVSVKVENQRNNVSMTNKCKWHWLVYASTNKIK